MTEHQMPVIVVGVTENQSERVLDVAAQFAERLHARLVVANVDPARYATAMAPDGAEQSEPADPDLDDDEPWGFSPTLQAWAESVAQSHGVPVETRELAGPIPDQLAVLAHTLGAVMLVVGTRHKGIRGDIADYFGQSVAVHLAHRQPLPVLVVPVAPVAAGDPLPWEGVA